MQYHKGITIRAVTADNIYGTDEFMDTASKITHCTQVISKIKGGQNIKYKGKEKKIDKYFHPSNQVCRKIRMRGVRTVVISINSARLSVNAHKKKRIIIAIKYSGEKSYQYIVATDLTWRTDGVLHACSMRWLIEVFFQDHKTCEGWEKLTRHTGFDGSYRSLTLSLPVDHYLLFHPEQITLIGSKLPAKTVGSLCEAIKIENLMAFMHSILMKNNPVEAFEKISAVLKEHFKPNNSKKHMRGENSGVFKPAPSLKYKRAA